MKEISIRPATLADVDAIMAVYDAAKRFMRSRGNLTQWVDGYPSRQIVADDIILGACHVGVDTHDHIFMAFAFFHGEDPTYAVIEGGEWLNDRPYGTIHRLGSDGSRRGALRACVEFCLTHTDNLRADTHADNIPMQRGLDCLGFHRCGIIICRDGTPRIAYHLAL